MNIQPAYTGTLTFNAGSSHWATVGSNPWDPAYHHADYTVFFFEFNDTQDITVFADSIEDATTKLEKVAIGLGAVKVGNIRLKDL